MKKKKIEEWILNTPTNEVVPVMIKWTCIITVPVGLIAMALVFQHQVFQILLCVGAMAICGLLWLPFHKRISNYFQRLSGKETENYNEKPHQLDDDHANEDKFDDFN